MSSITNINPLMGVDYQNDTGDDVNLPNGATVGKITFPLAGATTSADTILLADNILQPDPQQTLTTLANYTVVNGLEIPLGVSSYKDTDTNVTVQFVKSTDHLTQENFDNFSAYPFYNFTNGNKDFTNPAPVTLYSPFPLIGPSDNPNYNVFNDPATQMNADTDIKVIIGSVVALQAGLVTTKIVLNKDSIAPEDGTIIDNNGNPVNLRQDPSLTDPNTFALLKDYQIPVGYTIGQTFSSDSVTFGKNQPIPDGTMITPYIRLTEDDSADDGTTYSFTTSLGTPVQVRDLLLKLSFSDGTIIGDAPTFYAFTKFLSGNVIPATSNISQTADQTLTVDGLLFVAAILGNNYVLPEGTKLENVVPTNSFSSVVTGQSTEQEQNVPLGSKFLNGQNLVASTTFGIKHVLESNLNITQSQVMTGNALLASGSTIAEGTVLPPGSKSFNNMVPNTDITILAGQRFAEDYTLSAPQQIDASTNGTYDNSTKTNLLTGTGIPAGTTIPLGTHLTDQLTLGGVTELNITSKASLQAGMVIKQGSTFGPNFLLYGDTGFAPGFVFPLQLTFPQNTKFPLGTSFDQGTVFSNQPFPIPQGTVLPAGSKIPAGTVFPQGTVLPAIDFIANDRTHTQGVISNYNKFDVVSYGGLEYYMFPSGSSLLRGGVLPAGSILSSQLDGQTAIDGPTGGDAVPLEISLGDYGYQPGNPAEDNLIILPVGQNATPPAVSNNPTKLDLYMLADLLFTSDILIPVSAAQNPFAYMVLPDDTTLAIDHTLTSDYTSVGPSSIMWPSNKPISSKWTISTPLVLASSYTNNKHITLPNSADTDFITGVIPSATSSIMGAASGGGFLPAAATQASNALKFPAIQTPLLGDIRLGNSHTISNTGTTNTGSGNTIGAGTKVYYVGKDHTLFTSSSANSNASGETVAIFSYVTNATIKLAAGTKLVLPDLVASGYSGFAGVVSSHILTTPYPEATYSPTSNPNYTPGSITTTSAITTTIAMLLEDDIPIYPKMTLPAGTSFRAGMYTLGPLTFTPNTPMPGGIPLTSSVTTATTVVLGDNDDDVELVQGTNIAQGSIFVKGTQFPNGLSLTGTASIDPLTTPLTHRFTLPKGFIFSSDMLYPLLITDDVVYPDGSVVDPKNAWPDVSDPIVYLLQQKVLAIEEQLANPPVPTPAPAPAPAN